MKLVDRSSAPLSLLLILGLLVGRAAPLSAQPASAPSSRTATQLERAAAEAEAALAQAPAPPPAAEAPAIAPLPDEPNWFELWFEKGGAIMYVITFVSFLVVALSFERLIALRRGRTMPRALVDGLRTLINRGNLDPRQAYQLCQAHPSTLSNVLRAVLLKAGRPLPELEHTLQESSDREAAKLFQRVRTLHLAATVAPLLGLLGTVQGMIDCFYKTANQAVGTDKSQALANGIYEALVTTLGGLVVAIPAAILAHYFEGRIQAAFRDIHELLSNVLPQLERLEGKVRMSRQPGEPPKEPAASN